MTREEGMQIYLNSSNSLKLKLLLYLKFPFRVKCFKLPSSSSQYYAVDVVEQHSAHQHHSISSD